MANNVTAPSGPASDYHSLANFNRLHASQFRAMGLPDELWSTVHQKIYSEQIDATDSFRVEYGESIGFRVVCNVKAGLTKRANVWLIEHAWTTTNDMYRPVLRQHPELLDRLWAMLDLDRRRKRIAPPQPVAAQYPSADAAFASDAGGLSAADIDLMADQIAVTLAAAAAGTGSAAAVAPGGPTTATAVTSTATVSRDRIMASLKEHDFDMISTLCALTADDAATSALEASVNSALSQSIESQSQYTSGAAAESKSNATSAATATATASASATAAAAASATSAIDTKIDEFWRLIRELQDIGSYNITAPRADRNDTSPLRPEEITQCIFIMDQVGSALQSSKAAAATATATTAAAAVTDLKSQPPASTGAGSGPKPARVRVAPLCLVTIPDVAYSLMWLETNVAFDEVITRQFEPVQFLK